MESLLQDALVVWGFAWNCILVQPNRAAKAAVSEHERYVCLCVSDTEGNHIK